MIEVLPGQEIKLGKLQVAASPQGFSAEVNAIEDDSGSQLPGIDLDVVKIVDSAAVNRSPLRTGAIGSAKISNLAPGRYKILAPVRNSESPVRDCSPVLFEIVDRNLNDITIRCSGNGLSIRGRVKINEIPSATDFDCAIALKEGDDLARQDLPIYSVKLGPQGSFTVNGLRKTVYTLLVLPLKPSLEYEYVQIDGQVFHDRYIFGRITIDLRTGPKAIIINLIQK